MVHYWKSLLAAMQREKRLRSLDEAELPGPQRDPTLRLRDLHHLEGFDQTLVNRASRPSLRNKCVISPLGDDTPVSALGGLRFAGRGLLSSGLYASDTGLLRARRPFRGGQVGPGLGPTQLPTFFALFPRYAKAAADNNGFAMAAIITGSWSGFNTVDDQEGVLINSLTSR